MLYDDNVESHSDILFKLLGELIKLKEITIDTIQPIKCDKVCIDLLSFFEDWMIEEGGEAWKSILGVWDLITNVFSDTYEGKVYDLLKEFANKYKFDGDKMHSVTRDAMAMIEMNGVKD